MESCFCWVCNFRYPNWELQNINGYRITYHKPFFIVHVVVKTRELTFNVFETENNVKPDTFLFLNIYIILMGKCEEHLIEIKQ